MLKEKDMSVDLTVDMGKIKLKNPVLVASGTFGYGVEYASFVDISRLGGVIVKGTTLKPKNGSPPPRTVETPSGMLNAVGLANVGIDAFLSEKLPFLLKFDTKVIVNICGETMDEYVELARRLDGIEGVSAIEINISCPNVAGGGMLFGQSPHLTYELIKKVRKVTSLPLIAKLTPNVTDITLIAKSAVAAGADIISLINTLLGMAVDIETKRPLLGSITGGLSGPAIRPVALRMVWEVAKVVDVPIIGQGGICTAEDALAFIITGAAAVAVGTANFINPTASMEILGGIEEYLRRHNIPTLKELTGTLKCP